MPVIFVKPEKKYIRSYWETFAEICREKIYLAVSEPFPYDSTVLFMEKLIESGMPSLFVIDTDTDRCVGWCDAVSDDGIIGKIGIGISKPYRDRGTGTKLLDEMISLSRDYGYKGLELEVWKNNDRAVHIYEKAGFIVRDMDDKKIYMKLNI